MKKRIKDKPMSRWNSPRPAARDGHLRIIGGTHRGRQIAHPGDPRTRPMKDNIREAVFNLVGARMPGKYVIDLFAGSGAIGLEAISRGAAHAVLIERHIPTARVIEQNARDLDLSEQTTVVTSDTFFWVRQFVAAHETWPPESWAVFCSPPYDLYQERGDEMMELIESLAAAAPSESLLVVEADQRFSMKRLPFASRWRLRHYSPAQVALMTTER